MDTTGNIGVLDSGIGGLSILREIQRLLPGHPTIYFADQQHLPYGPRQPAVLQAYVRAITRFLRARGAAVIVIACNAASAASLLDLRREFPDTPFVGMEPAIKPAVAATHAGRIGVLTTQATADGALYRRVLERYAGGVHVATHVAPALVALVEAGAQHSGEGRRTLAGHLQPLLDAGVDQIVLACTHFPLLAGEIRALIGPEVTLIDPSAAVARQVARVWPTNVAPGKEAQEYYTSGEPAVMQAQLRTWLNINAQVQGVAWSQHEDEIFEGVGIIRRPQE